MQSAGDAAEAAANRKTHKYTDLPATHIFQPLAFETEGLKNNYNNNDNIFIIIIILLFFLI